MKVLFQGLCVEKVNWDENLEGEALGKWEMFINDLNALKNIRSPDVMPIIHRRSQPYAHIRSMDFQMCQKEPMQQLCT